MPTDPPNKARLDQWLVTLGLADTRTKAQAMIMAGEVWHGTQRLTKASHTLTAQEAQGVTVRNRHAVCPFVSRGGLKLAHALTTWAITPSGQTLLDVGASTGGFTDCLLQHGATRVAALDVGYGQLDQRLRQDPRVLSLERCNARHLNDPTHLNAHPHGVLEAFGAWMFHGAVTDVSFISLKKILPVMAQYVRDHAPDDTVPQWMVALLKPQFEFLDYATPAERKRFHGVIADPDTRERIRDATLVDLTALLTPQGWSLQGTTLSPIEGGEGNAEYLTYWQRS
jgi:23S rRNA (cytidine1920-2'-O)/16S rRNA (cytidine1409-2'-O)-methyltransferase